MELFYLWLAGVPITGIACSVILSKQAVTRAEDIAGSLMVSIFWPIALMGVAIGWGARGLRKWRNRNAN